MDDHIAELCDLLHDDIDPYLWFNKTDKEGLAFRQMLETLGKRIAQGKDLRAAEIIYAIATQAAFEVLEMYLRQPDFFNRIAPRRKLLPALLSIHPDTAKVVDQMRSDARLGTRTHHARQVGSKAYFVSDSPTNIYARAIIASVEMNRDLEAIETQQAGWAAFDRKEGVQTVVLPFPKYAQGLDQLPIPITPESVLQYWRKGKEIILEEMSDFHLRPEWQKYREARNYTDGAKKGAIRHAIFKDILIALKTIAGANKRKPMATKRGC
jgi:hypothetical protein